MYVNPNRPNTALLLFLRSVREEATVKQFSYVRGFRNNLKLIRLLNQRLKKAATQTGLPTFIIPGKIQKGQSFGERLANAFQQVFEAGFEKVIAIGNDCLEIDANLLKEAEQKLEHTDLLLGPDLRGGTYLIGVSKQAFNQKLFAKLKWQTASLLQDFSNYSGYLESDLRFLPFRSDVNNPQDLKKVIAILPKLIRIRKILIGLLQQFAGSALVSSYLFNSILYFQNLQLRAPPYFFSGFTK